MKWLRGESGCGFCASRAAHRASLAACTSKATCSARTATRAPRKASCAFSALALHTLLNLIVCSSGLVY